MDRKFRYNETVGFAVALAHVRELHPDFTEYRVKATAKTLYGVLFHGGKRGTLSLDFTCTKGHDLKTCRCAGTMYDNEWCHSQKPSDVIRVWHIGIRSLVELDEAEIGHFQVQTARHIRDFVAYIKERSCP